MIGFSAASQRRLDCFLTVTATGGHQGQSRAEPGLEHLRQSSSAVHVVDVKNEPVIACHKLMSSNSLFDLKWRSIDGWGVCSPRRGGGNVFTIVSTWHRKNGKYASGKGGWKSWADDRIPPLQLLFFVPGLLCVRYWNIKKSATFPPGLIFARRGVGDFHLSITSE